MMTALTYDDAYLAKFATFDREDRARADVDAMGTFPMFWRDKLTVLRVYVLICLEKQAEPRGLFTAKLSAYRKEFDQALIQARVAAAHDAGEGAALYSVPILRA